MASGYAGEEPTPEAGPASTPSGSAARHHAVSGAVLLQLTPALLVLLAWAAWSASAALLLALALLTGRALVTHLCGAAASLSLTGEASSGAGLRWLPTARGRRSFDPTATDYQLLVTRRWGAVAHSVGLTRFAPPPAEWWQGLLPWTTKVARLGAVLSERIDHWPPMLRGATTVPTGIRLRVRLLHGQRPGDYERAADALAAIWKVYRVEVTHGAAAGVDPGHVDLILITRDPLLTVPRAETALAADHGDLSAVPLGVDEDGHPWTLRLLDQPGVLIAGVPGAGKSALLTVLLKALVGNTRVIVHGVDLKGGADLAPWRRAGHLRSLATTPVAAVELLREVHALHLQRQDLLVRRGVSKVSDLGLDTSLQLIVVVIDEAADLFGALSASREDKAVAAEAAALASTLVRQGRATGITTVLATQKPTADAIPTQVRDACTARIALRCATPEQARAALADAYDAAPISPTAIDTGTPGVAIAANTDDTTRGVAPVRRVRVYDTSELSTELFEPPLPPPRRSTDAVAPAHREDV